MNKSKKRNRQSSRNIRRKSLKRKTMKRRNNRKTMKRRNNRKTMKRRNNRKTMKRRNNRKTRKRRSQRGGGGEDGPPPTAPSTPSPPAPSTNGDLMRQHLMEKMEQQNIKEKPYYKYINEFIVISLSDLNEIPKMSEQEKETMYGKLDQARYEFYTRCDYNELLRLLKEAGEMAASSDVDREMFQGRLLEEDEDNPLSMIKGMIQFLEDVNP